MPYSNNPLTSINPDTTHSHCIPYIYASKRIQLSLYILSMHQTKYNSLYIFMQVSNSDTALSIYSQICIQPDTTISISLCMYQIQIQIFLYILRCVSNTGYNYLYIFKYVSNPDTTLSISLAMHQTGYNSLYIFMYVSNWIQLSLYL